MADYYDSEEDEINLLDFLNQGRPRFDRILRIRPDYFNYFHDYEFVRRFRISKEKVVEVLENIRHLICSRTERNNAVPAMNRLLMALRFYATGCFMTVVGDFGGVSESSTIDFIHKVNEALATLRPRYVSFPATEQERTEVKRRFYMKASFPNVIGAIDCTHIKIISQGGPDAMVFMNRKQYYSINVRTICDADHRILDAVARWHGSAHDQRIFNNSRIKARFEMGEFPNCFLVGDSGYESRPYMMTPLTRVTSRAENLYNESQIRTRNVVERKYGIWKRRFPVLSLGIRFKRIESVLTLIHALTVLHNIALSDPLPDPEVDMENFDDGNIDVRRISEGDGTVRDSLIANYFSTFG